MAKKDFEAAAAAQLAGMKQTTAQKLAQQAQETAPAEKKPAAGSRKKTENTAPFTIWTKPENVRKWKAYQKAKKATLKTQNDFIVAAVTEYIKAHPVTDAEKAELLKSLEL